ncbi:MAG: SGNH/GDSL hydrolase family protein [Leptothrix ochracea]|uniref:SGNH/GDSL hydrolase family protein n=2 Tax=Leptothrix ochracea TaxID=735331 RepID=UPI0034E25416
MRASAERIKTVLTWLGYGLLALATLEMAARVEDFWRSGAPLLGNYSIESVFQPSDLGKEGRPGAHFGKWQMNALGFRGPELAPPSGSRSALRVMTVGASETFGLYESPERDYPRQLEALLRRAPGLASASVVNIALPGMRIGRTAYLERSLQKAPSQWVLIYPTPANYIGTTVGFCAEPPATFPASPEPERPEPRLKGKLVTLLKQHLPLAVMTLLRRASIRWAERHLAVMDSLPEATLDAFVADVDCALQAAQRHGARVVLSTHPNLFGPELAAGDGAALTAWRSFYPELREAGFLDMERRANARLRQLAAQRGVPLVDAAAQIPGGTQTFADFVHFTDAGAERMASLAAQTILEAESASPSEVLSKP